MHEEISPILEPIFLEEEHLGSLSKANPRHGQRIREGINLLRRAIPAMVAEDPPFWGVGIGIYCNYDENLPGPVTRMVEIDLPVPYDLDDMLDPDFVPTTTFLSEVHLVFSTIGDIAIAESGATMLLDLVIDGPDEPRTLTIMLVGDVLMYERSGVERCEGCGGLHPAQDGGHDADPERERFDDIISAAFDVSEGTDIGMLNLTYVSEEASSFLVAYIDWMLRRAGEMRSRFLQ